MAVSRGTKLGRYEIRAKIGAGGMGEVYLAQDTKLDRKVALKILPAEVADDKKRMQRFIQEAKTASSLNHPNILTIFEIEQVDATHFIATEFIDGETLRQYLKVRHIKIAEALDLSVQIASALSAAHAAGIIHRDIKPENIMRRHDGIVKVLDFGLAKLSERTDTGPVDTEAATKALVQTEPGVVLGTVAYMSPEQARGLAVDARTDIFSLGVVIYELVAGRAPFGGATRSDLIVALLERDPPPLARFTPEAPAELERLVMKTLAKDREERYQTAKDLLIDLKGLKQKLVVDAEIERTAPSEEFRVPPSGGRLSSAESSPPEGGTLNDAAAQTALERARATSSVQYVVTSIKSHKLTAIVALLIVATVAAGLWWYFHLRNTAVAIDSIAVLPFANAAQDPNAEYLSDGITESLINRLSLLSNLKVMSSSSVFRYKGKEQDAQKVGNELNVQAVLTGSVKQIGDQLVITVRLDDAQNNQHIWGEQYVRKFADILAVQSEIAQEVSTSLRLKLTRADEQQLTKRYTENAQAYQLYLKGRFYLNKRNEESLRRGIDYFQQAKDKDPTYALAYSGLADSYSALGSVGVSAMPPREAMVKMKLGAQKALELDDTLAEAHTSLADAKFRGDWDWSGAEREFKRALELKPNYAEGHEWYSQYLVAMGRFEESIAEGKRAQQLDPVSPGISRNLGFDYYFARRYDQAIEEYQRALELDPNFFFAHWLLGAAYANKSMFEQAIAESRKAVELSGHGPGALGGLGSVYAASGRRDEAQQVLGELKELAKRRYVSPYSVAAIYARLGDKDSALEWLEKAYRDGAYGILFLNSAPEWDRFRSDPRFAELVRRVGLPQ